MGIAMGKNFKAIGRVTLLGAALALGLWKFWEAICRINGWNLLGRQFALVCLGLAICCVAGWLVYRKYQRDMNRLFTPEERQELDEIVRSYQGRQGRHFWAIGLLGAAVGSLCGFLYAFCGQSLFVSLLPFVILIATMMPWTVRSVRRARGETSELRRLMAELKSKRGFDRRNEEGPAARDQPG
jgi:hypothetical protein